MTGECILAVDDSAINLRLATAVLSRAGYHVLVASDAEEALAMLCTAQPRLILMDIQLPGMDGLELTRRLKADPERRGIVVIALTSYAMSGDEVRARQAGCDGYIAKPLDTRSLASQVAAYIREQGRRVG
jgi:two-component system, cell cycle response regulator DivK